MLLHSTGHGRGRSLYCIATFYCNTSASVQMKFFSYTYFTRILLEPPHPRSNMAHNSADHLELLRKQIIGLCLISRPRLQVILTLLTETAHFLYPQAHGNFSIVIGVTSYTPMSRGGISRYYAMLIAAESGKEPSPLAQGRSTDIRLEALKGLQLVLGAEVEAVSLEWQKQKAPLATDVGGLRMPSTRRQVDQAPPAYQER